MQIYKIDSVTNFKVIDIGKNEVIYLDTENKLSIDQSFYQESYGFKINKYEIGYYNVNVKILRHFLENTKSNWCLIYEKGVKIRENFNSIAEQLNMLPTETELVFPYDKLEDLDAVGGLKMSASKLGHFWGSYIYLINRSGAKKILDLHTISKPFDETLLELSFKENINTLYTNTGWFKYDEEKCKSFIARKSALKKAVFNYPAWNQEQKQQAVELLSRLVGHAEKLNIKLMLHAGTLLGAVRHGGIMPWDDDLDISILYKDLIEFNKSIKAEGLIKITKWVYKKTGNTYYKYWLEGGEKVDGYEYTFPFVDFWIVYEKDLKIDMCDGYTFDKNDYLPPMPIQFEGINMYTPNKPMVVLDAMYKNWKEEIRIFTWCHRLKKAVFKPLSLSINVDQKGRLVN